MHCTTNTAIVPQAAGSHVGETRLEQDGRMAGRKVKRPDRAGAPRFSRVDCFWTHVTSIPPSTGMPNLEISGESAVRRVSSLVWQGG